MGEMTGTTVSKHWRK